MEIAYSYLFKTFAKLVLVICELDSVSHEYITCTTY